MKEPGWDLPYPSRRQPVLARNVVATSQPLAAQAGLSMLARGGNAVDAALAAAIALTVVEPTHNGVGSDAFAIVGDDSGVLGLNASGRSPAAWTPERFAGREVMPGTGWESVTVPGAVSAWSALSQRLGALPFERLFEPALRYARDGFAVSPVVARQWQWLSPAFAAEESFAATFLPEGRPPRAGETFRNPDLAETLEAIAATRGESFYRGPLAGTIAAAARAAGGALSEEDLASHRVEWVTPLACPFAGAEALELPPNTQGIAALVALGVLRHTALGEHGPDTADSLHLQIEAMKTGLALARGRVGDPERSRDLGTALDESFLRESAGAIQPRRARPFAGGGGEGDTVYLCAADAAGRMVSFIQSNYVGFGSGVVVPGTGISLQNRGAGFTLAPGHVNEVAGGKRPFHTLIPGFVTVAGRPWMAFGVMGGPMQAQGHVQMLVRILLHGQNPQAAADAPRWQVLHGLEVAVEPGFPPALADGLRDRGHQLVELPPALFGGAQLTCRLDDGYLAASEPRKDGQAVGF